MLVTCAEPAEATVVRVSLLDPFVRVSVLAYASADSAESVSLCEAWTNVCSEDGSMAAVGVARVLDCLHEIVPDTAAGGVKGRFEAVLPVSRTGTLAFKLTVVNGDGETNEQWIGSDGFEAVIVLDRDPAAAPTVSDAVRITSKSSPAVTELPAAIDASGFPLSRQFVRWSSEEAGDQRPLVDLLDAARHIFLERPVLWWLEPNAGTAKYSPTKDGKFRDIELVLVQRTDGTIAVLIPLPPSKFVASREKPLSVILDWNDSKCLEHIAYVAVGKGSPQDLVEIAARDIQEEMRKLVGADPVVQLVYKEASTWDAFYHSVSEEKVFDGLQQLQNTGIVVNTNDKFPSGFGFCRKLKEKGVKYVGVWHTLTGYWGGISPDGEISQKYALTKVEKMDGAVVHIVDPSDISRFYEDMHDELRMNGIDFVKVDYQAFFDELRPEDSDRTWASYQNAMIEQAAKMVRVYVCVTVCCNALVPAGYLVHGAQPKHSIQHNLEQVGGDGAAA
ncbi:hypothetical protein HDU83_007783 [Entophlyctis luteolus]|nr:hypothetical protein HDU83_007783 [Entophlyctis luteolus]